MEAGDIADSIAGIRVEVINNLIDEYVPPQSMEEQWDIPGLHQVLEKEFGIDLDIEGWLADDATTEDDMRERVVVELEKEYDAKAEQVGPELMRTIEKEYMLKFLDMHWREHIGALDYLRQGIGLRSYAQKNPKQEYKREAFEMFGDMLDRVKYELIAFLSQVRVRGEEDVAAAQQRAAVTDKMQYQHAEASALAGQQGGSQPTAQQPGSAVRNAPAQGGSATPAASDTVRARCAQGRSQRSLSVWFRQEVQALPRQACLIPPGRHVARTSRCGRRSERRARQGADCAAT